MKKNDCILVSVDFSNDEDHSVMCVGRQEPGKPLKVINAFQGEEAVELYKKLTTLKKKNKED